MNAFNNEALKLGLMGSTILVSSGEPFRMLLCALGVGVVGREKYREEVMVRSSGWERGGFPI